MVYYNLLLIHDGDKSHRGGMRSGRCGIHGSPCVIPRPYLTKSASLVTTRSSQLCLIWLGNGIIGLRSSGSMYDMLGVTRGVW